MRDQLVGMRADFKDALVEFRAALRVVTDAESGYVPRSEIATKFAAQEQMDDRIAERVDALQRWIVGTGLAVLTLAAAVFGAAHR